MSNDAPSRRLGAQLWVEPDADAESVDALVARAAASGVGLLRIFLMWPWIEREPGVWDFEVFDHAFAAALRNDVRIKATLTANSGPWHIGTPSALHSHTLILDATQRPAIRRYVEQCVSRYAGHAALDQWVIWNEPFNVIGDPHAGIVRSEEERAAWTDLLERLHDHDLAALNRRWRTGYRAFSDVPFPEEIPHPAQRRIAWLSYGPWLDEYRHRADWLRSQLSWVAGLVRALDERTPVCANPSYLFNNHAMAGYQFPALAGTVDVVGASFHPPWSFGFAPASRYAAVMVAATSFLAHIPGVDRVEVTETQLGNVYRASPNPRSVTPAELATSYLAPQFAGAESVTGWSLNARRQDYEAGEWGLLDDDNRESERSRVLTRVAGCLDELQASIGTWHPRRADALVLSSSESQAVEMIEARINSAWEATEMSGRRRDDAVQGMYLLTAALLAAGVPAAACPIEAIPGLTPRHGSLVVASHVIAYPEAQGRRLLELVEGGVTLLVDGTTGHRTTDAQLHRPWPGVLAAELGFRSRGLTTRPDGFPVALHGAIVGKLALAVADPEFSDPAWTSWTTVRGGADAAPLIWERPFGSGRVVFVAGALGPSLVADARLDALVRYIVTTIVPGLVLESRPLTRDAFALVVEGARGTAVGVFGPDVVSRGGQALRLRLPRCVYRDLWNGGAVRVVDGEVTLEAPEGIALLVPDPPSGGGPE